MPTLRRSGRERVPRGQIMPAPPGARARYWSEVSGARRGMLVHEGIRGWALSLLAPAVHLDDLKAAVRLAGIAEEALRRR